MRTRSIADARKINRSCGIEEKMNSPSNSIDHDIKVFIQYYLHHRILSFRIMKVLW